MAVYSKHTQRFVSTYDQALPNKEAVIMQTITQEDARKAFETRAGELFRTRLDRIEWLPDDPHEPTGEVLPNVFHAALHVREATPEDVDAAADLACAVEEQFDDVYTILSHTLPAAA